MKLEFIRWNEIKPVFDLFFQFTISLKASLVFKL